MPIEIKLPEFISQPERKATGVTTSTYGWDTAFAIQYKDANAAIVKAKSSPKTFSQVAPDKSCSLSGSFGDWQLTGGDGVDLHMSLPLTGGTGTFMGHKFDLAGAIAIVEIQLNYLPPPPKAMTASPSNHNLKPKTTAGYKTQPASVLRVLGSAKLTPMQQTVIEGLLGLWLNANLDEFDHTFSAVTLNRIVDKSAFKWLAPTDTGYACLKRGTADTSILSVLCMTDNRSRATLASQVSPNAIPDNALSGFVIAQERFLEKMVLPGLPKVFPGSKASDFKMSSDGTKVVNVRNVKTKPVPNAGTTYYPEVTDLEVSVQGDQVVVYSKTKTDIALGSYSEVEVTSFQWLVLKDRPDGKQTLSYEEAQKPVKNHTLKTTKTGKDLQIIIEIAAAILTIILTIVTEGAFLVIALIIIGLLVGLMVAIPQQISDVLGKKISNASPSMALLTENAVSPTVWAASGAFTLTSAGMASSLVLGGNPGFA
jgi:hypothetical protein